MDQHEFQLVPGELWKEILECIKDPDRDYMLVPTTEGAMVLFTDVTIVNHSHKVINDASDVFDIEEDDVGVNFESYEIVYPLEEDEKGLPN